MNKPWLVTRGSWLALFLLPLADRSPYHMDVLTTIGLYAILALGLQIIVGFAGILNLGFAAFFGIGAYTYALMNLHWDISFWLALPIAGGVAALCGVLLGTPVLRVSGDYLAIVTLGFGEIARIVCTNLEELTGGPNGLLGIAHPKILGYDFGVSSTPYYYLVLILLIFFTWTVARLKDSRIGRAWLAMREDPIAAQTCGIPLARLSLMAFGAGAFLAGVAGCVFASKQGTITPDSFDFILSVMILAMVVLGGLGNVSGTILSALILGLLPEVLRDFAQFRMFFFGLAMILVMLLRPQGLFAKRGG